MAKPPCASAVSVATLNVLKAHLTRPNLILERVRCASTKSFSLSEYMFFSRIQLNMRNKATGSPPLPFTSSDRSYCLTECLHSKSSGVSPNKQKEIKLSGINKRGHLCGQKVYPRPGSYSLLIICTWPPHGWLLGRKS